ncbi:MAG: imidazoleglycerol-phosphate dehydratase [Candidatus Omnitrophica bacterium]|nr:imidazoleglycerol-phosphate dehydratase [Candidatus Omnitrophota bacterium]MBD3268874.1 imidazoleglycerol-phosphate dehydratase [Candidatus Omnitrophota bacterium]
MREVNINRKTNEVRISGRLNIDGEGRSSVETGFEPLNHLLRLFAFHGFFDLELIAQGDLKHHIIEDIGIALGKAFSSALGEKEGIKRYGSFSVVMDKVLVEAGIDISGRPVAHGVISAPEAVSVRKTLENAGFDETDFTFKHAEDFLEAFVQHAGISLVYVIKSGQGDLHHILEALFKAVGKALDEAIQKDSRRRGIPSTKGIID